VGSIFHRITELAEEALMKYMVEPIGAQFSNKDVANLADVFTQKTSEGYRLHSVFQVSQPGCLGIGHPTITYLAVYERME
jgi:energy-converting hydrogenase A subunit M